MNYKHLSIEERSCIRKYYVEGQNKKSRTSRSELSENQRLSATFQL